MLARFCRGFTNALIAFGANSHAIKLIASILNWFRRQVIRLNLVAFVPDTFEFTVGLYKRPASSDAGLVAFYRHSRQQLTVSAKCDGRLKVSRSSLLCVPRSSLRRVVSTRSPAKLSDVSETLDSRVNRLFGTLGREEQLFLSK